MRRMAIVVAVMGMLAWQDAARAQCVGDCGGDDTVAVSDMVKGVNIALGNATVGSCASFDANSDGLVTISELVRAVANVLFGCGYVSPTPTSTPIGGPPTPTPTIPQVTATPTSGIVPPGIDSRMLGTFRGTVQNSGGQTKTVRVRVEVANNQVRIVDVDRNLFTASGSQSITPLVANPTTLSYNRADPPNYIEIFQCGLGRNSLVVQYSTTNFSFPPQATSFAGELPREG